MQIELVFERIHARTASLVKSGEGSESFRRSGHPAVSGQARGSLSPDQPTPIPFAVAGHCPHPQPFLGQHDLRRCTTLVQPGWGRCSEGH